MSVFYKIILIFLICLNGTLQAETQKLFYIDPLNGDNANVGNTPENPLKDIKNISSTQLVPGSKILFKAGTIYKGSVTLVDVKGTANEPVTISTYWDGMPSATSAATINAAGYLSGIQLDNCSFIDVSKLKITANGGGFVIPSQANENMRLGVLVRTTKIGENKNIHLSELTIFDIFYQEKGYVTNTQDDSDPHGYGIRFFNQTTNATLKNIVIENCTVTNVSHTGIRFSGKTTSYIDSINVISNTITHVGGPGMMVGTARYGRFAYNTVDDSGSGNDSRNWKRGSGLWTWSAYDILVERNNFSNAKGKGDSCGSHIDYNCTNVVMQYNFSYNNAGGFIEVLGNNFNCSYRYNISVNDGWRVKGVNGADQEGKTIMLSGFSSGKSKGPYFTYIYNNTIFVKSSMIAKYSFENTAQGILIANNIFCVTGDSRSVLGDQTKAATQVKVDGSDVFFKNNLFLNAKNWPEIERIKDAAPFYGNPFFPNSGGLNLTDYIPKNVSLIKGKGIVIPQLPGDTIGLKIGLKVESDILGKPVGSLPDMGAISVDSIPENAPNEYTTAKFISHGEEFFFTYNGAATLTLYALNGQIIQTKRFVGSVTFTCPTGIYIINIKKN
jgi:hypothetical protein